MAQGTMRWAMASLGPSHAMARTSCHASIVLGKCSMTRRPQKTTYKLSSVASRGNSRLLLRPLGVPPLTSRRSRSTTAVKPLAMVNVDVSPSVILGVGLIGAGVSLWQIRQSKPWISKDYDVVVSCISLLVGGILIFQGWRLDPLLLFGQLMTTGAAVSFGVEALRLRSEVYQQEEKVALQDVLRRKGPKGGSDGGSFQQLPPPPPPFENPQQGWSSGRWADDQASASYYDPRVQDQAQPVGMYDSNGQYIEADYYDAYGDQQQYPNDDQQYSNEQYQQDDQQQYYNNSARGSNTRRSGGPTEFEFPSDGDVDGQPPPRGRRGTTQFGTGEDWD